MIESCIKMIDVVYINSLGYICIFLSFIGIIVHKAFIERGYTNKVIEMLPFISYIIITLPLVIAAEII